MAVPVFTDRVSFLNPFRAGFINTQIYTGFLNILTAFVAGELDSLFRASTAPYQYLAIALSVLNPFSVLGLLL